MENQHISNLFQGLRAKLSKHLIERATISKIIFEETKMKLSENDIVFKKGILTLKLNPLKKNVLAIKKEAIQKRIASETTLVVLEIR
jgi:hypothetical protein